MPPPSFVGVTVNYQSIDLNFPLGGLDVSRAIGEQTASVAPLGQMYDPSFQTQKFETTRQGINVRGFDPIQNRFRGGSRPGLSKYVATQVNGANALQAMGLIQLTGFSPPSGSAQPNTSGLLNFLVVVAAGTIKFTWPGAGAWSTPTSGASALNASGFVSMTAVNGILVTSGPGGNRMFFCDGTNYKVWAPATGAVGTVSAVAASAGTLPASGANKCRLSATWRGRWILSGLKGDEQNIFASRVGVATDFNYSPTTTTATQAWALNPAGATAGAFGQTYDAVTALIPINDDNLLIGCANSLFLLRGDPMNGGQLQCLEPAIGLYWNCWCRDTEGVVYFLSNKMGVYSFSQFNYPTRISQRIDPLLQAVTSGANTCTMTWDDWLQGFHLFITNTASPTNSTTHYFWEKRTGAWWQDQFAQGNHNPSCAVVFDGNNPSDRRVMLGCQDGYVRYVDFSSSTDDGTNIASSVAMGPIKSRFEQLLLADLRGELDPSSGSVSWAVKSGLTAQAALTNASSFSGTWAGGLNNLAYIRHAAKAHYILLSSIGQWGLEKVGAKISALGAVRERQSTV